MNLPEYINLQLYIYIYMYIYIYICIYFLFNYHLLADDHYAVSFGRRHYVGLLDLVMTADHVVIKSPD